MVIYNTNRPYRFNKDLMLADLCWRETSISVALGYKPLRDRYSSSLLDVWVGHDAIYVIIKVTCSDSRSMDSVTWFRCRTAAENRICSTLRRVSTCSSTCKPATNQRWQLSGPMHWRSLTPVGIIIEYNQVGSKCAQTTEAFLTLSFLRDCQLQRRLAQRNTEILFYNQFRIEWYPEDWCMIFRSVNCFSLVVTAL
jgi:hypothetical protein